MNILLLSVGTRNKIVEYFKSELDGKGKVIATDMSMAAPAIYDADAYYIVPKITDPDYMKKILDICVKENISGILSLIDPELSLLAAHRTELEHIGVTLIGSEYKLCELALNKMDMYNWLVANGFKCARTYESLESFEVDYKNKLINFPVFVKPKNGSASISSSICNDYKALQFAFLNDSNLIVQQFMDGDEIGADVYVDLISGETVSIFTKYKLIMRAGETDKAVSFKDEKVFNLIIDFVKKCGWRGQIDIDLFCCAGELYISEVNPRFGGGYPHAYECGCNHMKLICNNIAGIANEKHIGKYDEEVYMMKYNEVMVRRL